MSITEYIKSVVTEILSRQGISYPDDAPITEAPQHIEAEYSLNVAMQLSRTLKRNPREIAEELVAALRAHEAFTSVEIAGPGFINVTLAQCVFQQAVAEGADRKSRNLTTGELLPENERKSVCVEYISANPSGPMHIGNARGGPIGETVARVFAAQGHKVFREFYVNDIGGQANRFAASVMHHYKQYFGLESTLPEDGYPADYVKELAIEIAEAEGKRILELPEDEQLDAMRADSIERMVAKMRVTSERLGIHFDRWYLQSDLVKNGLSEATYRELQEKDAVLEKEGAIWLKAGFEDEDRESVLVKSDGTTTYFLDDIAYHREKLRERGFDQMICMLGPGHYGHISRMKASIAALGMDPNRYEVVMYQNVQLKVDGVTVKMAKRKGNFVTANEVLDQIPREVFSFFMLSKANETHLDFDLKLALDTSEKNPVYYIQYAHARICSILDRAELNQGTSEGYEYNKEERSLISYLDQFPALVAEVAATFRVHLIPNYLHELATRYHHFYAHNRVLSDDVNTTRARLDLSILTAETLKSGLALMNIEAIQKM